MQQNVYKIKPISSNIYQIEEFGVYCYLIVGTNRSLLIDMGTGFSNLATFVKTITDKPIIVAATHAHPDHIGGRGCFEQIYLSFADRGIARFYGTLAVRRLMFGKKAQQIYGKTRKEIKKGKFRTKYLPLKDGDIFELGGKTVECVLTPGHTKGSMIFLLREEKILFSGDNLCRCLWMFLPGITSIEEWIVGAKQTYALLNEYTAYSAHDAEAQEPELIAKLIESAKKLVAEKKNSFFPKVKVFPPNYTDHGILYRTTKIRMRKRLRK